MPIHGPRAPRFTLKQLQYIVAVSQEGGVTQAARLLNVAPSSISEAIAQLEQGFGFSLFVRRHAQGVATTPDGVKLIASARRLLEDASELEDQAASISMSAGGTLQLGCFKTIAPIVLPRLMRSFADAHPQVKIGMAVGDQVDLLHGLRNGSLDLALTYDAELGPDISFRPLRSLPPYILLGAKLAARYPQDDLRLADIVQHDLILLDLPQTREYYLSLFRMVGLSPRITHRTTALSMVKAMAANDFGYGLLNERSANDRAVDGSLLVTKVLLDDLPPLTFGIARISDVRPSRRTQAFIEVCSRELGSLSPPSAEPNQ